MPIGRHGRAVRAPPMLVEHLLRQIISIQIPYTAYLSLVRKCKEQTVQTPIGNTILCSIWICTVCHCPWLLEVFFFFFSHQRSYKTNHQQNYLFDTDLCNAQAQDKSERTTRVPIRLRSPDHTHVVRTFHKADSLITPFVQCIPQHGQQKPKVM